MTVSVVVPAYNEEKYIERCIESLLNQEEKPDEIIIVDNNSKDNTAALIKKYPVRLVHEKKQGMIYARNRGFNEATHQIIARTDADSEVPSNWIKLIKRDFTSDSVVAVTGSAVFGSRMLKGVIDSIYLINKKLLKHDAVYGPNYALRRSVWQKIKDEVCLDDSLVHEDIDISIHLVPFGRIHRDRHLVVKTSARRIKDPASLLFDYLPKWRTTISQPAHKLLGKPLSQRASL